MNGTMRRISPMTLAITKTRPHLLLLFAVVCVPTFAACSDAPQELTSPALSAAAAPAVPPLVYAIPGTWNKVGEATSGTKRANYKVPKTGSDTEDAELTVFFFGTGSLGDPQKTLNEWFGQFDGNASAAAVRKTIESPAGKVDIVDVFGTYKVPLGPAVGPKKKSPMQMVKDKWRLYGAIVKTADRGNWFFKLVGPDETVQASKQALESALAASR